MRKTILAAVMAASILITGCENMPSAPLQAVQALPYVPGGGSTGQQLAIRLGGMILASYAASQQQKNEAEQGAKAVVQATPEAKNDRYIAVPVSKNESKPQTAGKAEVMIWDTQEEAFVSDEVVVLKEKPQNGESLQVSDGVQATYHIPPGTDDGADL